MYSGTTWDPSLTSSSEEDVYGAEPPAAAFLGSRRNGEETINLSMNAKLASSHDGRASWFWYEDLAWDWTRATRSACRGRSDIA